MTTQLGIRLPDDLIAAIDAAIKRDQVPGITLTRSDVIRQALYASPILATAKKTKPAR